MRSLRRALAARFAATMAAGLTIVSAALFAATSRLTRHQLDQALAGAQVLVAGQVESPSPPSVSELLSISDPARYARDVNRYAALRSGDGRLVRVFPLLAADLPLDSAAWTRARTSSPVWVTGSWHGRSIRSVYVFVPAAGTGRPQAIQVTAYLAPVERVERGLLLALVCVVVLGTGSTLVGAWWLAGSAVRPVAEITRQATRIEAGTLSQRIVAHADTLEYHGLVAVLNRMLERLDAAFQAQHRLTADVSHELRTPLTALRGEIEVALRADRTSGEYRRVLESALEEIEGLTTMSEDLLLITRAEAQLVSPQRAPTSPNALVEEALTNLEPRIGEKNLTVVRSLDAAAQGVSLDGELVTRLIEHLLDNAVKYTPPGGRIAVSTEALVPASKGVRFAVENSGVTIAPEDLAHIFEPFYRVDQARGRDGGTGLGLALVAAIARLHGGAVRARDPGGRGVRLEVELPGDTAGGGRGKGEG
jgi:signal transduction histidine kinase